MKDIMGLMGKMQELQAKMESIKDELAAIEAEGVAGGGLVRLTATARGEIRSLKIDPSLFSEHDVEILEDLIVAAHTDAGRKAQALAEERMAELTADLPLPPGMKLPI